MKLSSLLSAFILLTVCSTNILGNPWYYFFPRGSLSDLKKFDKAGKCRGCNLQDYDLREIINKYKNTKIDLSNSNCTNANLSNVDLTGANLNHGQFNNANFENSNLTGVDAEGAAEFERANMRNTNMQNAKFNLAILGNANLQGANLEGVDARATYLYSANMKNTNIKNANFCFAYLAATNFKGAQINEQTSFEKAMKCESVDFRNIDNLDKANFKGTILQNCKKGSTMLYKMRTTFAPIVGWFSKK